MTRSADRHILQFCHGYDGPFLDCARQYASLFAGSGYKVTTVFLTGVNDPEVAAGCASDEVLFMEFSSKAIRGLKLGAIGKLRKIAASRNFSFCIAHRFKPIYIALLGTRLPVIGVHHAFGDYQRRSRKLFAGIFRKRLSLLGVLPGEWVVGNVGRLHPDKDQATLLKGFAQGLQHLAAMDHHQRQRCAEMMLERLRTRFSDQAVRDTFWQLPHVIELTAGA
jgi:glycosyltransferase involved in cell wall biosynthesis